MLTIKYDDPVETEQNGKTTTVVHASHIMENASIVDIENIINEKDDGETEITVTIKCK
jgi:hypothetical protein